MIFLKYLYAYICICLMQVYYIYHHIYKVSRLAFEKVKMVNYYDYKGID
jgi:hypothetical protein